MVNLTTLQPKIKIDKQELARIFDGFNNKKVLVIGDVMLDSYWWGKVERISPEAPVPVVNIHRRENRLGGAANVALNLRKLGAKPVLAAILGQDREGGSFLDICKSEGIGTEGIVSSNDRPTTVKTRVVGNKSQLLRIDSEENKALSGEDKNALHAEIKKLLKKTDLVIFEDYDKGVIDEGLIKWVIDVAKERNIPVAVDPKKRNFLAYKSATLFKPNLRELAEGLKTDVNIGSPIEDIQDSVNELIERLDIKYALITLSERGVYIAGGGQEVLIPAHIRNIYDVSGAGDTVISVAALALLDNCKPDIIAALANLAGGLVCEKIGAVPIDREELFNEAVREFC